MFFPHKNLKGNNIKVSILMSVFNEEKVIKERIENLAIQDFDFNNIEVLIGSDGSYDSTNKLLNELMKKFDWLKVFIFEERRGKAIVLNDLINESKNEILVFTDANTVFEPYTLNNLIESFSDNSIGGISGRLVLKQPPKNYDKSNEERRYWEYETFIKRSEGRCGTLIGANGGIFAIRRSLIDLLPSEKPVTDDLFLTLSVLKKRRKFIYKENAIAYEDIAPTIKDEFNRKIRFSSTNFETLKYFGFILKEAGLLTNFCYLSHKVIRWFIPLILLFLPIINIFILNDFLLFKITLVVLIAFLIFAFIGLIFSKLKIRFSLFSIPFFFILTNFAILLGLINFIIGKQSGTWQPTPREKV